jgi:hypothetical protein
MNDEYRKIGVGFDKVEPDTKLYRNAVKCLE